MAKPSVVFLVILLCLWACGSAAASSPVLYFGFPTQVYFTAGTFIWLEIPPVPGAPVTAKSPFITGPNQSYGEPEDPFDPPSGPLPVIPDVQGDLSGQSGEQEPPP